MTRLEFLDMLRSLANQIEAREISMLDASEELRGLAYDAENIHD